MQIMITMERMLCAKPDNKWYFFRGVMGGDDRPETTIICKGSMAWQPNEMETLALIGEWVSYNGERQFQFKSAKLTLPLEPRGQLHYICQRSKGIGIALEQAIWDCRQENFRDLNRAEIKKMSNAVYDSFQEQIQLFDRNSEKGEIVSWLETKGCSANMANAAYDAWGSDTAGVVTANCYRLAHLAGYSFKVVDENIRRNFEIGDDDPRRIRSGVEYALQQEEEDGSTSVECNRHLANALKLLPNIGRELIIQQVREMINDGSLYIFLDSAMLALKSDYNNEKIIFDYVTLPSLPSEIDLSLTTENLEFTPDESQIKAVSHAVKSRFSIINGGAGVGKTTVIKMIAKGIKTNFPKLQVKLCAFAGKAAARLKEATNMEATTIHVMLMAQGADIFKAGSLEDYAIIVDESSMVDSALLAEILKRNPAKVVLVGDQAQLPPVGKGQPFHDIINLYPSCVRTLSKCYRATEAVFQAATKIRNGNLPVRQAESENERWCVTPITEPELVQSVICEWAKCDLLDFEQDIILCPKNGKKDENGKIQEATVNALNEELLSIDRAKRNQFSDEKFLAGDRVINTVNNPQEHIWNGTTGTVQAVDGAGIVFVKLDVPFEDATGELKDVVRFTKEMAKNLKYAYALTVHKSQGSQYRKVIMVCVARDKFQLDRNLIYTGVTRTKNECIVVGDYTVLKSGIDSVRKKNSVLQCF